MKNKKKFKDTVVGSALIGVAGLINPTLGKVLEGTSNVQEAIKSIGQSDASPDAKIMLQEFALRQFEAEVADRATARQREAAVAQSGGSDLLFKTIGWTVALTFLIVIAAAMGFIPIEEQYQRGFDMAFGAVVAKMTAVVSYYFGSSIGSKQKTDLIKNQ